MGCTGALLPALESRLCARSVASTAVISSAAHGAAGELAASHHGVITRRQAADCGLRRHQIDRLLAMDVLSEPAAGVLVFRAAPRTWEQPLYAAVLSLSLIHI